MTDTGCAHAGNTINYGLHDTLTQIDYLQNLVCPLFTRVIISITLYL